MTADNRDRNTFLLGLAERLESEQYDTSSTSPPDIPFLYASLANSDDPLRVLYLFAQQTREHAYRRGHNDAKLALARHLRSEVAK